MLYKLLNGLLIEPINTIQTEDGKIIGNMKNNDVYWSSLGYKPLIQSQSPGLDYQAIYREDNESIIQEWEEIPEIITDPRIIALREKYKQSTNSLCQLAGAPVVDKLEDEDYELIVMQATSINPITSALLTQTIMYCLFQLYRLDGDDAWEKI